MIRLTQVTERNWLDVISLHVREEQQGFLAKPIGIVARGYVYRSCNARVFGISDGEQLVGAALVRDLDEEPSCYDLQQFLIDERFQGRGYGSQALGLILSLLSAEGRYNQVEVCVHKDNAAALKLFRQAGFEDTGYIDQNVPDCRNLMLRLGGETEGYRDTMISDFSDPLFRTAFRQYFSELGIQIRDWDGLFGEMDSEGDNVAFVRISDAGAVMGFLMLRPIKLTGWFFQETCGFLREFWIAEEFRNRSHGSTLLCRAERYLVENGIYTCILTTKTAAPFYEKHGYVKAPGCRAKNKDAVFVKHLT